jgi:parallel beta helix pectate lyase-like protein
MNHRYFLIKENNMNFRQCTRWLLVVAMLVSALSLSTPAAQAAGQAQTSVTSKVIWCPVGVTVPTPRKNGCTDAFVSMGLLFGTLAATQPNQAGTVWIGKGYNNTAVGVGDGNQVFDGAILTRMAPYSLTIKGGWNGLGTGTVSTSALSTFDGASFTVQNWTGAVSVRNLLVKNAVTAGCAIPAAVCVGTAGKIKLDRVSVIRSGSMSGASLNNTSSVSTLPGSVTVTNSLFLDNDYYGLSVETNGAVVVKNVNASQNIYSGAYIDNSLDSTASPVTVIGAQFYGNGGDGLITFSNGTGTLTNLLAQDNQVSGTVVDNIEGVGDVQLKGLNTFLHNGTYGLNVNTNGNVNADQLAAHDNGSTGVQISARKAVTISGSGRFTGNNGDGLNILAEGPIVATNLTATSNRGDHGLSFISYANSQAVTLNKANTKFNFQIGILINALGKVTLSCGTSYGNAGNGLTVSAASALKLQGFRSSLNDPDEYISAGISVTRTGCP